MTYLVAAIFPNEYSAITSLLRLLELDQQGDITVYENVVLAKNADGLGVLTPNNSTGFDHPSSISGLLKGFSPGPIAALLEILNAKIPVPALNRLECDNTLFDGLRRHLEAGRIAIIAETDEDDTDLLNAVLLPTKAVILRSDVEFDYGEHTNDRLEEIEEEIAAERSGIKVAVEMEKNKINQRISRLKEKRAEVLHENKNPQQENSGILSRATRELLIKQLTTRIEKHKSRIHLLQEKLDELDSND